MASLTLTIRAVADLEEAVPWYEARSARTARRFEAAVIAAQDRIAAMPEMYGLVGDRYRLCPITRFPYLLVYTYDAPADEVKVVAAPHASQDPASWPTGP